MPKQAAFLFTDEGKIYLQDCYLTKQMSTYKIAKEQGCHFNTVNRALRHHKIPLRNLSEAQKNFLSFLPCHPSKDKPKSRETKKKLSLSCRKRYRDNELRKEMSKRAKAKWDGMTEEEKKSFRKRGLEAHQQALHNGSRFEHYLYELLLENNFKVIMHAQKTIHNERMHIDLFLPGELVAIEVDGPSHFFPIYGQKSLNRSIQSDRKKNELLLNEGYAVIRIATLDKKTTRASVYECGEQLVKLIRNLESAPILNSEDRFFLIEVGNREKWRKEYGDIVDNLENLEVE